MIAFSQLEGRTLINAVLRNKPTSLLRPPLIVHSSSSPMQFIQIKTRNVFIVCMYVCQCSSLSVQYSCVKKIFITYRGRRSYLIPNGYYGKNPYIHTAVYPSHAWRAQFQIGCVFPSSLAVRFSKLSRLFFSLHPDWDRPFGVQNEK